MFLLPLREINLWGVLVTPAAPLLLICLAIAVVLHYLLARVDLNRFVWNRPLFEVAIYVVLFTAAILTLRH